MPWANLRENPTSSRKALFFWLKTGRSVHQRMGGTRGVQSASSARQALQRVASKRFTRCEAQVSRQERR
jgi:hypothetical protein